MRYVITQVTSRILKHSDVLQIGKEILMPEFPLTIRLIGLRVTKLKDLKAEADSKAAGIMKVFEYALPTCETHNKLTCIVKFFGAADGGGSPTKKRRVDVEDPEHNTTFEDAMPGYHEEAEAEDEAEKDAMHIGLAEEVMAMVEEDISRSDVPQAGSHPNRPRPPNSAPPTSSQEKPMTSGPSRLPNVRASSIAPSTSTTRKRRPQSPSLTSESAPGAVTQTCPVCSKTMVTDNDGLNAHVDFCLSKEAIREAQATQVGTAPSGGDQARGFKPKSIVDLLSGPSKKRAVGSSHGLAEGPSRRKKRKQP